MMGYRLYREVLDHAPTDLPHGELVVWLVIADDANDNTRLSMIPRVKLTERTRMRAGGLDSALRRLAERGYELRVVRGKDKAGRPLFSYRGTRVTYVLPVLEVSKGPATTGAFDEKGPVLGDECSGSGRRMVLPQQDPSPQSPQVPSSPRARKPPHSPLDDFGATEDEKKLLTEKIKAEHQPRNLDAYVNALAASGDLARLLDEVRAEAGKAALVEAVASARRGPECPHGVAGGDDQQHPQCALCRRRRAA